MNSDKNLLVSSTEEAKNLTVLRISSVAKNNSTEFFSERVQVSQNSIFDLNRKILEKLNLHKIRDVNAVLTIQFKNDKTVTFVPFDDFKKFDLKIDSLTNLLSLKWSFIFDSANDGNPHLHSVYVRICERPNPGIIMQKMMTGFNEDLDSLDNDAYSPIVCKVDFIDNRFSVELQSVVREWVLSLPKAEHSFDIIKWLQKNEDRITSIISGTFPAVMILGYIGIWLGIFPLDISTSVRFAVAWILGGGAIFLLARYGAQSMNRLLRKQIRKICNVPVFDITAGDGNQITKYMAKSKGSMFSLVGEALVYGAFKAVGLYFATYILDVFIK